MYFILPSWIKAKATNAVKQYTDCDYKENIQKCVHVIYVNIIVIIVHVMKLMFVGIVMILGEAGWMHGNVDDEAMLDAVTGEV